MPLWWKFNLDKSSRGFFDEFSLPTPLSASWLARFFVIYYFPLEKFYVSGEIPRSFSSRSSYSSPSPLGEWHSFRWSYRCDKNAGDISETERRKSGGWRKKIWQLLFFFFSFFFQGGFELMGVSEVEYRQVEKIERKKSSGWRENIGIVFFFFFF